jgi:hypothetical protein
LLAAQLNMALAQLAESDDVKTRVTRLSRAANFAPGSLIEEAAIRRITALAAKQKDHAKFLYWADRYLRRYPQSLYGAEFDRGFVEAIAAFGGSLSHFSAEDYARILDNADSSRNVAFATAILRVAIGKADVESCERVAHALPEGATHSQELQALISSCQLGRMEGKNNADLKLAAQDGLSPETAKLLRDAVSLTEAVAAESDDGEEGFIGPVQPPAFDADHAGLAASVTQQLNATMAILNRADGHAPDPTP